MFAGSWKQGDVNVAIQNNVPPKKEEQPEGKIVGSIPRQDDLVNKEDGS